MYIAKRKKHSLTEYLACTVYNLVSPRVHGNDGLAENEWKMKMEGGNLSVCCVLCWAGELVIVILISVENFKCFISRAMYYYQARTILQRPRL